ncbi:RHS repeat-associated protein [Paraburkholderia terricola]|uniref:RHS repeat-associated core domain-containing protein n=1 Tax=Paraburkholderia terricola TaxID=169427 RepID=UPI002854A186|nr:RHS repeat-associated core domain-containing protein [Paraburkholderia terricola]MDR6492494.1 RHS repeat-associated protein [Paraburkholderia terricola]
MQFSDAFAARRALLRPFVLFFFVMLSWFVAPHARAVDCDSRYASSGAYPADPMCPVQAAAADFGGMGGYVCGDPTMIAAYCSGPSGNDTTEPATPEVSMPDNADNCTADATAGCGNSTAGADPVNLYTGQFYFFAHDLTVADTIPLDLARVYRSGAYDRIGRPLVGSFGAGGGLTFDTMLAMSADRQRFELRQATGIRVPFTQRAGTNGKGWDDLTSPGEYYRARIDAVGSTGMTLSLRDGRVQKFTSIGGVYRLSSLQDRNGNTVTIARDGTTGAITAVSGPNGRTLTFTSVIGTRGTPLISRVTDALNRQVNYQYDSQDRLTQVTDAGGGVWKYGWDEKSRLVSVTDPEGHQRVLNAYDDSDRVVAQTLADGSTFAMAYTVTDGKVTRTEVTDRRGSVRRLEFDANGRVVRNTYPAGRPMEQVGTFTYDANGRVTNLASMDRQYTYVYDANGNRISEADQYGTLVTRSFDSYSQMLTEAQAGDPQRGVSTVYTYDPKGNLLTVTDRLGNRTTYTNDSQGRPLTMTDALKGVTKFAWTGADLTSVTDPLNRTTQFTTDAVGRVTAVRDPLGNTTRRTVDALDRTTDVTDALGGVTRFTRDLNGRLLSQADPKGVTTRYAYNAVGRPVSRTDPLGRGETYTWNSAGQLATVTDRKGQVTTYTYDAAGRALQTDFRSAAGALPARSWQYAWNQAHGKLDSVRDVFPTIDERNQKEIDATFDYDKVTGNLTRIFDFPTIQGLWTYRYAPDTRDLARIEMDRAVVTYSRDAEHRVTQIQYEVNGEAPRTFGYSYDALGRLSQATFANGLTASYTWDTASQLTGITFKRADGSVFGDLTYGYDLAGRRTKAGGSLAKADLPKAVSDAQHNAANQLTRWAGKTLSYDLNGNLTSDGVNQYNWNEQNLLSQISGGATAVFSYDIFGRRTDRTVNGHRMQTTWFGDELNLMVPDGDWSKRIRVFSPYQAGGPDELTFRRIGDDASQDRYVLRDANNNVIALTDADQRSQTQYSYEPYGATSQVGVADPNTQQYTGRENDGTGLYYYRNRYYSPNTARFISEDPIGWASGQTNAYAYVNGNPVSLYDPYGFWSASAAWYSGPGAQGTLYGDGWSITGAGIRGGFGIGAGASYDPNGSPPSRSGQGSSVTIGGFAEAGAGVGSISTSVGVSGGVEFNQSGSSGLPGFGGRPYRGTGGGIAAGLPSDGWRGSACAAVGVEVTYTRGK